MRYIWVKSNAINRSFMSKTMCAHPAIINVPPIGVVGPKILPHRSRASTKPKMENENRVVPNPTTRLLAQVTILTCETRTGNDQRSSILVSSESRMLRNGEKCDTVVNKIASSG